MKSNAAALRQRTTIADAAGAASDMRGAASPPSSPPPLAGAPASSSSLPVLASSFLRLSRPLLRLLPAFAALLAAALFLWISKSHTPHSDAASPPSSSTDACSSFITVPVPRLHLNYSSHAGWSGLSYEQMARLRRPLILHGPRAPVAQWSKERKQQQQQESSSASVSASASTVSLRNSPLSIASLLRRFPSLPVLSHPSTHPSFSTAHPHKPLERLSGRTVRESVAQSKRQSPSHCVMREDAENKEDAKRRDRRINCTDEFEYFSLRLSSLPADLSSAAAPLIRPLEVPSFPSTAHQSNLWIGRSGIRTAGHFDLQFNFFAQLEGKKHFTLFAPSAPLRLFPNTHPHQAHTWPVEEPPLQTPRQKQTPQKHPSQSHSSPLAADESNEEEAEEEANPLPAPKSCEGFVPLDESVWPLHTGSQNPSPPSSRIRRYVADLSSGDVLLVPPLWFHAVTTVTRSVSVNVWSDAPEYSLLQDELYALPLPLESDSTARARVSALLYYLRRLILAVTQQGERGLQRSRGTKAERLKTALWLQWTTRWIMQQRFHRPLLDDLIRRAERAPVADAETDAVRDAIRIGCMDGAEEAARSAVEQWQTEEHEARWVRGITPTVQLFERIREATRPVDPTRSHTEDGGDDDGASRSAADADASSMDPSVVDQSDAIVSLLLANYVEWAMMAVLGGGTNGDARTMIDFVHCCFMRGKELEGDQEGA